MTATGWGAATDTGRVRTSNEDSYRADIPVFVVADGMGGHAAGEVASRAAVDAFERLGGVESLNVNDAIAALDAANSDILAISAERPETQGMGTTIAGLAVISAGGTPHWQVFNVGDCRVYRFADGHLAQLTTDHSEAEEMVESGQITREEARTYTRRNVVTRSLGTWPGPLADSWVFPPSPPERFLLCSDGLTNEVTDAEIAEVLAAESSPQQAAQRLVEMALESGGRDNITVVVVDGGYESPEGVSAIDEDTAPREILNV